VYKYASCGIPANDTRDYSGGRVVIDPIVTNTLPAETPSLLPKDVGVGGSCAVGTAATIPLVMRPPAMLVVPPIHGDYRKRGDLNE
jgi:hypothetical protein